MTHDVFINHNQTQLHAVSVNAHNGLYLGPAPINSLAITYYRVQALVVVRTVGVWDSVGLVIRRVAVKAVSTC